MCLEVITKRLTKRTLSPTYKGERWNELGQGGDLKLRLEETVLNCLVLLLLPLDIATQVLTGDLRDYQFLPYSSFTFPSRGGRNLRSQAVQLDLLWSGTLHNILWMNLLGYRLPSLAPFSSGERKSSLFIVQSFTPTLTTLEETDFIPPHPQLFFSYSLPLVYLEDEPAASIEQTCTHGAGPRGPIGTPIILELWIWNDIGWNQERKVSKSLGNQKNSSKLFSIFYPFDNARFLPTSPPMEIFCLHFLVHGQE